jgi:Sulfotransferase family
MGIADSPLRDRVIFVQGAPRSGTTWLVMLLATHPQIAGVEAESHLFEYGVDRLFDNLEQRNKNLRGLVSYVHREQLVDLMRDLCDGVFMAMRSNVGGGSEAEFVVEKTPTSFRQGSLDLRRKLECYPDASYLHIVRDGDAVTRSLMRAPWMPDRSEEACNRHWRECVGFTRDTLSDHPRYREVSYEELRGDPGKAAGELFDWLGVDSSEETLETVRTLSRERFSELGAPEANGSQLSTKQRARKAAREALRRAGRRLLPPEEPEVDENAALAFYLVGALRRRDEAALRELTKDSMTLAYRSAEGDVCTQGDEAREALAGIARQAFWRSYVSEWWATAPGGPREWWWRGPGQPFWTIFFSAIASDASRVDLAFAITPEDGKVDNLVVVSAGSPAGRPVRALSSIDEAELASRLAGDPAQPPQPAGAPTRSEPFSTAS